MADREAALRVSDAERERVAELLGGHMSTGRLEPAEFEARLTAAYSARTRGELAELLGDLPAEEERRSPRRGGGSGWWGAAWQPWTVTGGVCLLIWAVTSVASGEVGYFWPAWVIGPWGVVLVATCGWPGRLPRFRRARG